MDNLDTGYREPIEYNESSSDSTPSTPSTNDYEEPMANPEPTREQLLAMLANLQGRLDALEQAPPPPPPENPPPLEVQRMVNLKPKRPTTYSGHRNESLEAWIFQMDRYCQLLPVPAPNRVSFAGTFLKDHAAMWWRTIYEEIEAQPENNRWTQFITGLKEQFQPINTSETARTRLDQLKQKTSVRLYNSDFREIMLQLPNMHEADRVHSYIKGLKPAIASLVAMQQPDTLLAAQGLADTADTIQFQHMPRRPFVAPRSEYRGPTPMDLDAIEKLTDAERERLRKNGGCFRCRKTGHLARDCTLSNRRPPRINAIDTEVEESGKD